MSIRVMTLVWDQSRAEATELLLLLAIADFCQDDGTGAYPSIETLARKIRVAPRTVQANVRRLVELGELTVSLGGGRNRTNRYTVVVDNLRKNGVDSAGYPSETVTMSAERVQPSALNPDAGCTRSVSEPLDRSIKPLTVSERDQAREAVKAVKDSLRTRSEDDAFDWFWRAYPRKEAREKARSAFRALVKGGNDESDVVRAASNYAATVAGREPRYIKSAVRFLEPDGSWRDYVNDPHSHERLGRVPEGAIW